MTTISHEEIMARSTFTDALGNVFAYTNDDAKFNEAMDKGIPPEGMELVFMAGAVNPKYAHIIAAGLILYKMVHQSKIIFEQHSEQLMDVATPGTLDLGHAFEAMAVSLNMTQRIAVEGTNAIIANTEKYRK